MSNKEELPQSTPQPSAQQLLTEFLKENNIQLEVSRNLDIERTETGRIIITPPRRIVVSFRDESNANTN